MKSMSAKEINLKKKKKAQEKKAKGTGDSKTQKLSVFLITEMCISNTVFFAYFDMTRTYFWKKLE